MENMNTMIRSCLKSVPPFLVFLLQRKTSQIFSSSLGKKFSGVTITSKLHMLEEYICHFLRRWHISLGFYGEQGIEGIHSEFNTQSQRFDHMKEKTRDYVKYLIVNHHIATSPELAGKAPKPKERNLKRKGE